MFVTNESISSSVVANNCSNVDINEIMAVQFCGTVTFKVVVTNVSKIVGSSTICIYRLKRVI